MEACYDGVLMSANPQLPVGRRLDNNPDWRLGIWPVGCLRRRFWGSRESLSMEIHRGIWERQTTGIYGCKMYVVVPRPRDFACGHFGLPGALKIPSLS